MRRAAGVPESDPRFYGSRKLEDVVKAMRLYELREEPEGGDARMICIRK